MSDSVQPHRQQLTRLPCPWDSPGKNTGVGCHFSTELNHDSGSAGKESARSVGDLGSILELGRSFGERKGYPRQYSGLENSMDCIVHGVAKS